MISDEMKLSGEINYALTLNTKIVNSKDAEKYLNADFALGAYFCWKSESGRYILTNKSNAGWNHIVVPIENHDTLSEAINALESSFPRKYQHPIQLCDSNQQEHKKVEPKQVAEVEAVVQVEAVGFTPFRVKKNMRLAPLVRGDPDLAR